MYVMQKMAVVLPAILISSWFLVAAPVLVNAEEAADQVDPAEIIAYSGETYLTQNEIDAAFTKIAEKNRLAFIRDGAKVDQVIRSLLTRKALAEDAVRAGYDQSHLVPELVSLAGQKELAEHWLAEVVRNAPEADFEALAYEDFISNPDAYRTEEILDVSHILIATGERSNQDAELLADHLRGRLEEDPSIYGDLVMEYSDDPAKTANGGRYPEMRRGQMVPPFEQAAFALKEPGQISVPVQTDYGYHIIRLNARHGNVLPEYDEVKDKAVAAAKKKYYKNYRADYLSRLSSNPIEIPDGAVEIMARRHFGENLELAPDYVE
ncbi:MAG: hypothetical protein GWP58_10525 [Gammaproteobacteria bacterium]|jgi:peptidyl-prolyl cis-trans isomerase C|nr:hypothetical protein [Gammaproteobacteria bacterium]